MKRAKSIFLWCGERGERWRGWLPYWGVSAKWVLTFSNKHHHFRFAEEVASGLPPSALVSAKKFQGVLNSAKRIPAESRRLEPMEGILAQQSFSYQPSKLLCHRLCYSSLIYQTFHAKIPRNGSRGRANPYPQSNVSPCRVLILGGSPQNGF